MGSKERSGCMPLLSRCRTKWDQTRENAASCRYPRATRAHARQTSVQERRARTVSQESAGDSELRKEEIWWRIRSPRMSIILYFAGGRFVRAAERPVEQRASLGSTPSLVWQEINIDQPQP